MIPVFDTTTLPEWAPVIREWTEVFGPALAGLATIVAGVALILTWVSIRSNRRSAERQLRAYLLPADVDIDFPGDGYEIKINFVNTGQTPAHDIKAWTRCEVREGSEPEIFEMEDPRKLDGSTSVVGRDQPTFQKTSDKFKPGEKDGVNERKLKIYFWGMATYRDIFQCPHVTTFRFWYDGQCRRPTTMHLTSVGITAT